MNRLRRGRYLTRLLFPDEIGESLLTSLRWPCRTGSSNDHRTGPLSNCPTIRNNEELKFCCASTACGWRVPVPGSVSRFRWKPLRSLTGSSLRRWSDSSSFRSQPCISKCTGTSPRESSRASQEFWTASRTSREARLKWPSSGVAPSILLPPSPFFRCGRSN